MRFVVLSATLGRILIALLMCAGALNAQTPPAWPNADTYWGTLLNVDAGAIQTYLNGSPSWFTNVKLATDVESLSVDWTNPTALATATTNYNNSIAALVGKGILTGNYISGSNVVTATANLNEYPAGVVLLPNMPGTAQYCGTWPGQPWRQIICVTDAPTVTAFGNQVKAQWQAFPTQIHFVDNAASLEGGALGNQAWASQMANVQNLNTIAQSLGTRAIFNISFLPGLSLTQANLDLMKTALAGAGVSTEQPWQSNVSGSPTLTATAVAQYRQLLDAGIAVVMIASGATGQATPQQLATWVSTWRKPGDKLYLNQPFFKAPDPLVFPLPQPQAQVNCVNNSATDPGALQTAINGGGAVTVSGTCALGASTIAINNSVVLTGPATIQSNSSMTGWAVSASVGNFTIQNITFVNAGLHITGSTTSTLNNIVLTGNTWRDFTATTGTGAQMWAVTLVDPICAGCTIRQNTWQNVWKNGFPDVAVTGGTNNIHALMLNGGASTNTKVEFNTCNQISGDCLKGFNGGNTAGQTIQNATGVSFSYNKMTYVHRMGIELQGWINTYNSPKYAGNLCYHPAFNYTETYCYSLVVDSYNIVMVNNAAIMDVTGNVTGQNSRAGYAFEYPPGTGGTTAYPGGGVTRGNVVSGDTSVQSPPGWFDAFNTYQAAAAAPIDNNLLCGPNFNTVISATLNIVDQFNYKNAACPAVSGTSLWASNIQPTWTSANNQAFPSGGNGTWSLNVLAVSLPVRNVAFFLDGSSTAQSTQEIQDQSTTFASDRKWLYHSTINTSTLASGAHTIQAAVTDVSGAVQLMPVQSFTVGAVGTTCTNNAASDPTVLQNLLTAGGTVNLSGQTCNLGSSTVNIGNAVTVNGPATIVAATTQTTWSVTASVGGFTLHNLTFTNAGLHVTGAVTSSVSGITLTGNIWQNFTAAVTGSPLTAAVQIDPILNNSTVTGNTVQNVWTGGFPSASVSAGTNNIHGMFFNGGLSTNSIVESNTFNQISGTGIKMFVGGSSAGGGVINSATGVSISYNKFTYVHNFAIQTQGSGNTIHASPKYAGNLYYHPAYAGWGAAGFAFNANASTPTVINNAAIMDLVGDTMAPASAANDAINYFPGFDPGGVAPFPGGGTMRGNLIAGDATAFTPAGFSNGIHTWRAAATTSLDDNILCGPANNTVITATAGIVDQFNFKNASCPAGTGTALWSSNIVPTFTSANNQNFPFFGPATWSINVVSNLPIRSVAFAVDGAAPVVTQEIQDQSTTFATDRKWLYHATFDTTGLTSGAHTIVATITDINGGTQAPSQSFTAGNSAIKYTPIDVRLLPGQSITINFAVAPGGTWTVPAGSNAVITGQTATTVTVQAPATPIYALHQEHGCPVTPNDSIFATPASAFPINTNNAAWMSTLGPENVFPTATWESNAVTNATADQTNTKWFYTSAANGQTWKWPNLKSRYREGGAIAQTALADHHLVSVNTDDCTWYETYNDHRTDIQTGVCDHNLNIGTGCDAQSNYKYSGYTDLAAPVGTPDTNGTGSTQASDMPYEPMIIQLGELEHGTIHHPLAFTPSIGFVQASFSSSCPACILWPAGSTTGGVATNTAPPMGARAILKASYTPSGACNALCANLITALKTYGAVVADLAGVFPINVGDSVYSSAAGSTGMNQFLNLLIFMTPTNWTWLDESSALMDGTANAYTTFSPYYAAKPNNGFVTPANSLAIFNAAYGYVPIAEIPASVGYQENFAWYTDAQAYTPKVITNGNAGSVSYSIPVCSSGIGTCGTYDVNGLYTPPTLTCGTTKTLELQASIGSGSASDWQYINLVHVPSLGCPLAFDNGNSTTPFTAGDGTIYLPDGAVRFQQALSLSTFPGDSNFSQSYNGSANADATLYQTTIYSNFDAYIGPMYGLPHTNYLVTQFFGVGGGNNGGSCDSRAGWWNTSYNGGQPFSQPSFIDLNGLIVAPQYDRIGWESRQECYQPISFTGPMTVSADPAYIANHATEQGPGGFSAVKIVQDSGTSPHIQIIIPDGFNRLTPVEQIAPAGTIQLYDFPWFLPGYQQTASVWSIVSGPGSITPAASCTPVICYATFTAPSVQTISTPTVVKVQNGANSQTYTLWTIGTQSPL